jgi:hypothetical protein
MMIMPSCLKELSGIFLYVKKYGCGDVEKF